jgi:hypothetical protein
MQYPLEQVATQLGFSSAGQALCTDWDAAMRVPLEQAKPFLEPGFIERAGREVLLTEDMIRELVGFAARIAADEYVVAFFWYCRYRILNDPSMTLSWEEQWPPLDAYLGQEAGLVNVLVMLSAVPEMRQTYRRLGIPDDIVRDTVSDLRLWMETDLYYQRYRRWGITPWIARWLCHHWQGKILQLGRLQFSPGVFGGHLRAYRHRKRREVVAIAEAGIRFAADGNAWCSYCGNENEVWTSRLEDEQGAVTGNPITPDGFAQRQLRRLAFDEWEPALAPGDDILIFHIPAGQPMAFDECGESFRRAMQVFPRYFPEFKFRGFTTGTWLLDARLQTLLAPESNIVRMQRETYLFPGLQGDNQEYYQRIFGWGVTDINSVPWKTSLQKTIGAYLNNGGHFHGGYCFLLREDLSWGDQVYLRMFKS